ncbi:MAG: ABC transporter ATP-binding protein [Phycisphaerae bacterium]|nr:ABC transporter ATP-binding protein [Phycisphaerae bacterium]
MSVRITIDALTKQFSPAGPPAVDAVSLVIEPGELFFLLGPSGCGKTTLLRMIAGFTEPTAGRIRFDDRDVTHLPPNARNTGMVFQSYALWPHMTVEANVAFGLSIRKVRADEKRRRAIAALAAVRMEAFAARRPNALSGGQQQRVALARALVIRPDVLLLDEPLSNLDAKLRVELRSEIRRVCKESGLTGVYVTHDQKEALSMADRIAIMRAGRVVQLGTPAALYHAPASRFVAEFLGETNILSGRVASVDSGRARIETGAGALTSTRAAGRQVGETVQVSLRPEALHIRPGPPPDAGASARDINDLRGRVVSTTYLGEIAQHTVDVGGRVMLKLAQLNPGPSPIMGNHDVHVGVSPDDVVVLAESEG